MHNVSTSLAHPYNYFVQGQDRLHFGVPPAPVVRYVIQPHYIAFISSGHLVFVFAKCSSFPLLSAGESGRNPNNNQLRHRIKVLPFRWLFWIINFWLCFIWLKLSPLCHRASIDVAAGRITPITLVLIAGKDIWPIQCWFRKCSLLPFWWWQQ